MILKKILNSKKLFIVLVIMEAFIVYRYAIKTYMLKQEYKNIQKITNTFHDVTYKNFYNIYELRTKVTSSIEESRKKFNTSKNKDSKDNNLLSEKIQRLESLSKQIEEDFMVFDKQIQSFSSIIGKKQLNSNEKNNKEDLEDIINNLSNSKDEITQKIEGYKKEYDNIESTGINIEEDTQDDGDSKDDEDNTEEKQLEETKADTLAVDSTSHNMEDNKNVEGKNIIINDNNNTQNKVSEVENKYLNDKGPIEKSTNVNSTIENEKDI